MTAEQMLNEVLDHFARTRSHPGDDWAPSDDGDTLCLDYAKDGVKFLIDLDRDGTITLLWKKTGTTTPKIITFRQVKEG